MVFAKQYIQTKHSKQEHQFIFVVVKLHTLEYKLPS